MEQRITQMSNYIVARQQGAEELTPEDRQLLKYGANMYRLVRPQQPAAPRPPRPPLPPMTLPFMASRRVYC
jgi:hypothetical protein